MCIILDVHMVSRVLIDQDRQLRHVTQAIYDGELAVMYGGRLTDEYERIHQVIDVIVALDQAGLAHRVASDAIESEVRKISHKCRSNDEHIVGLARVSGARLLCTEDQDLQTDFRSKELINNPRGKIFKRPSHRHLVREACESCL